MARSLKDAFYDSQYRVGQGIYTRAVSQGDNSLTESNFTSHETFDTLIEDDTGALPEFVDSQVCMEDVSGSSLGMNKMAASQTAMDAVSSSQTAMDAVSSSQTAMDAVIASQLALDTIVASQTAMDAVSSSQTAMDAVSSSQTAMDAITNSPLAVREFLLSTHIFTSVYSDPTKTERFFETPNNWSYTGDQSDIVFVNSDYSNFDNVQEPNGRMVQVSNNGFGSPGDGSANQGRASIDVDFDNVNTLEVWTFNERASGGSPFIIDIDSDRIFSSDNNFTGVQRSFDVSSKSGVQTLTIGTSSDADGTNAIFGEVRLQ